jgi:hypothetical protein
MTPEFDFFGLYFSSIVPRFLLCLALWIPIHALFGSLQIQRWIYFPALFHLAVFLILLATVTFYWHP